MKQFFFKICPLEGTFKQVYQYLPLQGQTSLLNPLYFQGFTFIYQLLKKLIGEGLFTWFFTIKFCLIINIMLTKIDT
jgi:hypothetical protein